MRWWISLLLCACATAGPVEFGVAEYNAALASRHLKWKVQYELTLDPPETYRVVPMRQGAQITGGDLRGLMYGLLDAADQIRATGHLKRVQAAPVVSLRGIRRFVRAADLEPESFWRGYFETLARDRFNRFTLIFLDSPYASDRKLAAISQAAADYGIEFTLGIWMQGSPGPAAHDGLRRILASCPWIRTIEIRSDFPNPEPFRNTIFDALRETGRRVAIAPVGPLAEPTFLKAADDAGVAIRRDPERWPPDFEFDLPRDYTNHSLLYWICGRMSYDPKAKPEYAAAGQIVLQLAAAQAIDPNMFTWPEDNPGAAFGPAKNYRSNDWIASIPEAVGNRLDREPSAKRTALDTADALMAAAANLDKTTAPDLKLLARMARYHAHKQRAAYWREMFDRTQDAAVLDRAGQEIDDAVSQFNVADARISLGQIEARRGLADEHPSRPIPALPKTLPRPKFTHSAVTSIKADKPLTLTLGISGTRDTTRVRLLFRLVDELGPPKVVEKPALPSNSFTIPAEDLPPGQSILYYFEILNRANGGWFEPDPTTSTPYHVVRIEPK